MNGCRFAVPKDYDTLMQVAIRLAHPVWIFCGRIYPNHCGNRYKCVFNWRSMPIPWRMLVDHFLLQRHHERFGSFENAQAVE